MNVVTTWRAMVAILFTVICTTKGQQCSLPVAWHRVWFTRYLNGVSVTETFMTNNRTEDSLNTDSALRTESFCEGSETFSYQEYDYDTGAVIDTIEYNTVAAFKSIMKKDRYCFEGTIRGDIIIYRATPPVNRTVAYAIEQCIDNLGEPTSWNSLIKYNEPGNFAFTPNSFTNQIASGTYTFTYKNGAGTEECIGQGSTATVTGTSITTASCYTGTTSYEKPLNVGLTIVGMVTDEELSIESNSRIGGLAVLAYPDSTAPAGYYLYLARYKLMTDEITGVEKLMMMMTTNDKDLATGYAAFHFIPPVIRNDPNSILFYYLQSTECEASNPPCKNNGTCTQQWLGFSCACQLGFSGPTCADDEDNCALTTSPCNNNGRCVDALDDFDCECFAGWGGDRCDEVDPCNPQPCGPGTCEDVGSGDFVCNCPNFYAGKKCELFDRCSSGNPCDNGGSCFFGGGSMYRCACTSEWTGQDCEIPFEPPTGLPPGMAVCMTDDDCLNEGTCDQGRCQCEGFWTGARCQVVSQWFIASIALIVLLVVLLIVILIVCCCCCYGGQGGEEYAAQSNVYNTMDVKSSIDGVSGVAPMPGTVQFNVLPAPSAQYNNVLTSTR